MSNTKIIMILFTLILASCSVEPVPIEYNNDECAYCKMKISDARFGAEIVTSKGKVYKYDSAECLVRTYIEDEEKDFAFIMVTDYNTPEKLIDAKSANFIISKNQPSPMGGFLSAYEDQESALKVIHNKGGKVLDFEKLVNEYLEVHQ